MYEVTLKSAEGRKSRKRVLVLTAACAEEAIALALRQVSDFVKDNLLEYPSAVPARGFKRMAVAL